MSGLRSLVILLGVLALSSCVSNVGHEQPFAASLGKDLTMKRKAYLFQGEGWSGWDIYVAGPKPQIRLGSEARKSVYGDLKFNVEVPAGTRLRLKRVLRFMGDGWTSVQAEGRLFRPDSAEPITFFYDWAYEGVVERAPWEDLSVPAERRTKDAF